MKFKGLMSTMLVATMLLSIVPIASASLFPDVSDRHSWAEPAVEDMASRGILKGFPDGTFKPDNSITKLDSLIIASRIMGYNDPANEKYINAALNLYKSDLDIFDIEYKGEVAYLLYRNVLKVDELTSYIADAVKVQPLRRHEAAILLTKLMGAENEVLSNTMVILDFSDDSSIPASSKAYVDYVNKQGIMNGMGENEFVPLGEVTRAMMATMMYRVEQKSNTEVIDATVISASPTSSEITATTADEETITINVPSDTVIKVDGNNSSIVSLISGVNIRVHYQNDKLVFIEAIAADVQFTTSGTIKTTGTNGGTKIVTIVKAGADSEQPQLFSVSNRCDFKMDGAMSSFNALKQGMYVVLEIKSGVVTSISAETKEKTYKGTVQSTASSMGTVITVKLNDGSVADYTFAQNATVLRNGNKEEARMIAVGDTVEITVQYGAINKIVATSLNKTTTGTIEEIIISSSPKITIKEGGQLKTYGITGSTKFIVDGGKEGQIYDLRLGATATLQLESENIARIETKTLVLSSVLTGTISYINPSYNAMGIDVVDATGKVTTIQTVVKSTVKITDTTASKITQFKSLTAGRMIVATGTVNYGIFEVSSITIAE